jgi:hypothetical protein
VCLDETSKQLIIETRAPIPAKPGRKARHDYEYERNGVANLFMVFAPLEGCRHVKVTDRHTAIDYAPSMAGRDTSVTAITVPDISAGSRWFITVWTVCTELISSPCTPLMRTRRLPGFAPLATVTDTYEYCPVAV